jgi:hypothetical protein
MAAHTANPTCGGRNGSFENRAAANPTLGTPRGFCTCAVTA